MSSYKVIYEDDNLICINKSAGMLTIQDRFNSKIPNLRSILQTKFGEIFVVHRLDKDTSGCVLFAKDAESHQILNTAFEERRVKKLYHCITEGAVPADDFEIDIPLRANPTGFGVHPSARGKESLTIVKVIERFRLATYIECNIITGRQHQIRAHLSAIGHPLLVDEIYGNKTEFFLSSLKRKFNLGKNQEEKPIISRITMHSQLLEFIHPITKELITCISDMPKDFEVLLKQLRKYNA